MIPALPHVLKTPPSKKKSWALSLYLSAVGQFKFMTGFKAQLFVYRLKKPIYVMQLVQRHLFAGPVKNNACLSPGEDLLMEVKSGRTANNRG